MMEMIFDWVDELKETDLNDETKMTRLTNQALSHGFLLSPILINSDPNYENYVSSTEQYQSVLEMREKRTKLSSSPTEESDDCRPSLNRSNSLLSMSTYLRKAKKKYHTRTGSNHSFQPWNESPDKVRKMVKKLSNKTVLSTWGMLYCGNSAAIESALQEISTEYKLSFQKESIIW